MSIGVNPTQPSANRPASAPVKKWKLTRWDWLLVVGIGVVTGAFSGAIIGYMSRWTLWDVVEFGAYGAWASAIGATFLAVASVWLAVDANKNARKAEARAVNDIEERRQGDIRNREYQAVEVILKAVANLVTALYDFKRYRDSIHFMFTPLGEEPPKEPQERQRALHQACNSSAVEVRLALMQFENQALYDSASVVMKNIEAVVAKVFDKDSKQMDLNGAVAAVGKVNEAGQALQIVADTRFRQPRVAS